MNRRSRVFVEQTIQGFYGVECLILEHEIDGGDEAEECCDVVPMQVLALEHEGDHYREDGKRDDFLHDLQLEERERTAVDGRAHAVGWHHEEILYQRHAPRGQNDEYQRPVRDDVHLLQLQVAIPRQRHENVGNH